MVELARPSPSPCEHLTLVKWAGEDAKRFLVLFFLEEGEPLEWWWWWGGGVVASNSWNMIALLSPEHLAIGNL